MTSVNINWGPYSTSIDRTEVLDKLTKHRAKDTFKKFNSDNEEVVDLTLRTFNHFCSVILTLKEGQSYSLEELKLKFSKQEFRSMLPIFNAYLVGYNLVLERHGANFICLKSRATMV